MRFLRSLWIRLYCCWFILRGRHVALCWNILNHRPTVYNVLIYGGVKGQRGMMCVDVHVLTTEPENCFEAGSDSVFFNCTAIGGGKYGFSINEEPYLSRN